VVSDNFAVQVGIQSVGLAAGSRVAGYKLEEQIGSGGMAVVFRARDERLQRQVALKILAPALAADEAFRRRFIRESRAAAAVDDPHIIPVFEAGEADRVLFIAMRYVPGGDVRTLLRRVGPLSPGRAMAVISPVACALDAAHGVGLVHRDVKPANILVDARPGRPDHVYLSDFGLSKGVTSSGPTRSGQFLGTPDYSAPEQIEGKPVDGRADQYSLACAAFELLCGEAPFPREHATAVIWAHMSEPAPMLTSRQPGLPPGVDGVLAKALAKAPGDRYASCREFAEALRETFDLARYNSGFGSNLLANDPRAEAAGPAILKAAGGTMPAAAAVARATAGRQAWVTGESGIPREATTSRRMRRRDARHHLASQNSSPDLSSYPAPDVLFSHVATQTNPGFSRHPGHNEMRPEPSNLKRGTGRDQGVTGRRRRRPRIRSWPVVLSLAAAVAVLGSVTGLVMTRSPSSPSLATRPQLIASYAFPLQRYGNGLLIERRWTLSGKQGSQLTETITASNANGKPIAVWFQDSIPTAITNNVKTVRFNPDTVKIVQADPIVEWYLRLPAHRSVTVGYVTAVPPKGATTARLGAWAKGLDVLEKRLNMPAEKHPRQVRATNSPTQPNPGAESPTPTQPTGPTQPAGNTYPTYSCNPQIVTCNPNAPSSPSPSSEGF
jgi:serine/threonine protein kinase